MRQDAEVAGVQHKGRMIVEPDLGELIDRTEESARLLGFQTTATEPASFPEKGIRERLGAPGRNPNDSFPGLNVSNLEIGQI